MQRMFWSRLVLALSAAPQESTDELNQGDRGVDGEYMASVGFRIRLWFSQLESREYIVAQDPFLSLQPDCRSSAGRRVLTHVRLLSSPCV
jgi:hypothetical protein